VSKLEYTSPSKKQKTNVNKFLISYQHILESKQENLVEIFRKQLDNDITYNCKDLFKFSYKEEEEQGKLISMISEQQHRQTKMHSQLMQRIGREAIIAHNMKKNLKFFSRTIDEDALEENDPHRRLVNGPNGHHYKILSNPLLEMLERNGKSSKDLWIEPTQPAVNQNWLISGHTEFKRYKCWCHKNIYMRKYIRTELMRDCNTNTTMQICVECGRVWKDVDDYVCDDFLGYTKVDHLPM